MILVITSFGKCSLVNIVKKHVNGAKDHAKKSQ